MSKAWALRPPLSPRLQALPGPRAPLHPPRCSPCGGASLQADPLPPPRRRGCVEGEALSASPATRLLPSLPSEPQELSAGFEISLVAAVTQWR